jgi:general secretion pathway protein L
MSKLLLCLPSAAHSANTSYGFALTHDGSALSAKGSAVLSLLPSPERGAEVVAILPACRLSWHVVELPKGVGPGSPRLRAVLENLLEDQLLDEPSRLHLALLSGPAGFWVAACDRAWLSSHLQALDSSGRGAYRLVAEFAPETREPQIYITGELDNPELILTGRDVQGVLRLPLSAAALLLLPPSAGEPGSLDYAEAAPVLAEPALAALAEQLLERKVGLLTRELLWLDAARSGWDLAQFEFANSGRSRKLKRLALLGADLLRSPGWRPARWGFALLLLGNLIGLNALAWKEQSAQALQRAAIDAALVQTFPQVQLVINAPLQMEREVNRLRLATGAVSGRDLEPLLAALAVALPSNKSATGIEFSSGQASIKGLQLSAQETSDLALRLRSQAYTSSLDGETLKVSQTTNTAVRPEVKP